MDEIAEQIEAAIEHQRAGRLGDAETIYQEILGRHPDHADAIHLSGMAAHARGDFGGAASLVARAIKIAPETPDFHANLGVIYLSLRRPVAAAEHCRRALGLAPEFARAHYNLGNALFELGQSAEAVTHLRRAAELDPDNSFMATNYLFALNFPASVTPEAVFRANRDWGARLESAIRPIAPAFANDRRPGRRLRLGYVLMEPATHVTPRFLAPVLAGHDRGAFEVFVYADHTGGEPAASLVATPDHWRDLTGRGPAAMAAAILDDAIDVLVHSCAFKARYREVLAYKPAPVQISAVNHVSTTGLGRVDYLITDAIVDPPGETEAHYTERLLRLDNFNCYLPPRDSPMVSAPPAADNGFVTFASFNNPAKMTPMVLGAWARILAGAPGNRLLLKHRAFDDAETRKDFATRFGALGGDRERLDFAGFTAGRREYLGAYEAVDIALDPFPFGGGTTTYEALWMGVPVITLKGATFMSRVGASLVSRAAGPEFVAADAAGYVATALGRARDLAGLAEIRSGLRQRASERLFDAGAHIAELEAAYRRAWTEYCDR